MPLLTGQQQQQAYLTFVLKKDPRSPQMPTLVPQTPLQWRRHFLAGQRRAKRLNAAQKGQDEDGVQTAVKDDVRTSVMDLSAPKDIDAKIDERGSVAGSKAIETIEVEVCVGEGEGESMNGQSSCG